MELKRISEICSGEVIENITIFTEGNIDILCIKLECGLQVEVCDNGQSCCEHRYMNCDDNLSSLVGEEFRSIKLGESSHTDHDYDVTDIQFLKFQTNKDSITIANYNEHNGYYGGFSIESEIKASSGLSEKQLNYLSLRYANHPEIEFSEGKVYVKD